MARNALEMVSAREGVHEHVHEPDNHVANIYDANLRLLDRVRTGRVRHESMLRDSDRKIRTGIDMIRRATLRVVPR